jgi:hypothetical protein
MGVPCLLVLFDDMIGACILRWIWIAYLYEIEHGYFGAQ